MPEGFLEGKPAAPNCTGSLWEDSLGCCRPNSDKFRFVSHDIFDLGCTGCLCPDRELPAMVETDLPMCAREDVVVLTVDCRQFLQTLEAARRIEGSIFGVLKQP